jgi:hypothetical protein
LEAAGAVGPAGKQPSTRSLFADFSSWYFILHLRAWCPFIMDMDMDTEMDERDDQPVSTLGLQGNSSSYRPRGYQLEMLEASRHQNIIVAVCSFIPLMISLTLFQMDTGSGKTHM